MSAKNIIKDMFKLADLTKDTMDTIGHLQALHISHDVSELQLVFNGGQTETFCETDEICPQHRYTLGIALQPKKACQCPYHVKRGKVSTRPASAHLCKEISKNIGAIFLIGESICTKCRLQFGVKPQISE